MKESKALIDQTLRGERPARTPVFDIICNTAVLEHFAQEQFDGVDDEHTVLAAIGRMIDGSRWLPTPGTPGDTYVDWMGTVMLKDRWTTWVKQHALPTLEDWPAWIERTCAAFESLAPPAATERSAERARQEAFNARLNGTTFLHCTACSALEVALYGTHCGLENFSYLWFDQRDLMLRWFAAIERRELRAIELAADAATAPFVMLFSDIACKGRLLFGREMLGEIGFFDNIARLCAAVHAHGLKAVFHSDGYIMEIVPDLIAAGVDGLNPIEKAAGMDIYEVRKRWPELIIVGGMDVTHLLRTATPAEVRRETRRIIAEVGAEGRLLIGSTTELEENVPLQNYLAFHTVVMQR